MPDVNAYDAPTGKIKDDAINGGVETHLRIILKSNGLLRAEMRDNKLKKQSPNP